MGGNISGSTEFNYRTKTGIPITYIFYDLKGKNRFKGEPSSEAQVNKMFEECLNEIDVNVNQLTLLKEFNKKYKYRFAIMTQRKIAQYDEKSNISTSFASLNEQKENENKSEKKRHELDERIKEIEEGKFPPKIILPKVDRFINEKRAQFQFIEINGIVRILKVLEKQIKNNKKSIKTNFSNQIDILRFIKSYSSHYPKQFYSNIQKCQNYGNLLMDCYHPVHVGITSYVLSLLQDYLWRCQNNKSIFIVLKEYIKKQNYSYCMKPFAQTLENTNNILMVYYHLKFINELLGATVDEEEREALREEMINVKYSIVIQNIKARIEETFYEISVCTFQYVHQQICRYETKGKKNFNNSLTNPEVSMYTRNTVNIKDLQEHIMMSMFDLGKEEENSREDDDDDDEEFMTVYLDENSKSKFDKFILDVLFQISNYLKLEIYADPEFNDLNYTDEEKKNIIKENKIEDIKVNQFIKHIRNNCIKNDCTDVMFACLKNLQFYEKNHWKKLDSYILEELGINKKSTTEELQIIRKTLKDKEELIKKLMRENTDLKVQIAQLKSNSTGSLTNVGLPPPPIMNTSISSPPSNTLGLSPPPPPPTQVNSTGLPLPPPPPSQQTSLSTSNSSGLPPPPPPPSQQTSLSTSNSSGLPPPPPPPSSQNQTSSGLPPPPPPPSSQNTISNSSGLPPPPPPPSSQTGITNSSGLPPPPPPPSNMVGMSSPTTTTGLPPPPPPPIGGSGLSSPPPPPPPIGGSSVPKAPTIGSGLPPPPSIGGGLSQPQGKVKQKKKTSVPLKTCNYAVLAYEKIVNTIWEKVDDEKVKIDIPELEKLFAKNEQKKDQSKGKSLAISQKVVKKEPVKILGPERWRNVEIILMKLKIPKGAIKKAITECEGKYMDPLILESINKIIPSQEERQMIEMYSGDEEELGKPQIFFKELLQVPQYSHRIKSIIFASHKEEAFFEVESKLDELTQTFNELRENKRLHTILETSLAVGNYLNGTSFKGGAWGFKLQSLQRLQDVKSGDNKMNAAYFIIRETWKNYEYPVFSKGQLEKYQQISRLSTSQVNSDLGELRKALVNVRKAVNSKQKDVQNDRIAEHCEQTKLQLQLKVQKYTQKMKQLEKAYHECAEFYCQDPKKNSSDQIGKKLFKTILFISNTEKTLKVLDEKWKKQAERKAIKAEIKFVQEPKETEKENEKKQEKKPQKQVKQSNIKPLINLPLPPELPKPPVKTKEERMKEFEKTQQKALEDMMKRRQTKMTAYRKSRAPQLMKNTFQDIGFLKGLK